MTRYRFHDVPRSRSRDAGRQKILKLISVFGPGEYQTETLPDNGGLRIYLVSETAESVEVPSHLREMSESREVTTGDGARRAGAVRDQIRAINAANRKAWNRQD